MPHSQEDVSGPNWSTLFSREMEPNTSGGAAKEEEEDDFRYASGPFELASNSVEESFNELRRPDEERQPLHEVVGDSPSKETVQTDGSDSDSDSAYAERRPYGSSRLISNVPLAHSRFARENSDMIALCGSQVNRDGSAYDTEGNCTGEIVEGLPWVLEGHIIRSNGEIFDNNGQLLGRAIPLPRLKNLRLSNNGAVSEIDQSSLFYDTMVGNVFEGDVFSMKIVYIHGNGMVYDEDDVSRGLVKLLRVRNLTPQELALVSPLKGLKLRMDGMVYDKRRSPVAYLIRGDPEDSTARYVGIDGWLIDVPKPDQFKPFQGSRGLQVAPLPGAAQAAAFSVIKGCRVQLDGRVRDKEGTVVARQRKIDDDSEPEYLVRLYRGIEMIRYRQYIVGDRGEILDDEGKVFGLVDLLEAGHSHERGPDCPSNCFDCRSLQFESASYWEQVELLANEIGYYWQGWPPRKARPRLGLWRFDPRLRSTRRYKFDAVTVPQMGNETIETIAEWLDQGLQRIVCLVENVDKCLATRLGCHFDIEIDFFYEHYCLDGEDPDLPVTKIRNHRGRRGTLQGFYCYSGETIDRHRTYCYDMPYLSTRLSYIWLNEKLLLLLVDGPYDPAQFRVANASWGEWRFEQLHLNFPGITIPLSYGADPSDERNLFDVVSMAIERNDSVMSSIFSPMSTQEQRLLFPDLIFDISIAILKKNVSHLEDDVKCVSFDEIETPNPKTNRKLHVLRAEVHYIKAKLHQLRTLAVTFSKDGVEDNPDPEKVDVRDRCLQRSGQHCDGIAKVLKHVSRTEDLLKETFQLLMSSLTAEDNRQNLKQGRQTKRITVLAFIYVPLSFVTGVFGMNLKSLNGSSLPYWVCLIAGAVVAIITAGGWIAHWLIERREESREQSKRNKGAKMV